MANNIISNSVSIPIPITAPGLINPNYGENIDKQFENIDINFKHIVGTDFLKGNDGSSAYATSVKLIKDDNALLGLFLNGVDQTRHSIYTLIKESIINKAYGKHSFTSNNYSEQAFKSVTNNKGEEVNWYDNLNGKEIVIFYELNSRDERHIISILPFNFLDERFCNINYKNIPSSSSTNQNNPYENIYDLSGIILLERTEWDTLEFNLSESIPALYYNEDIKDSNNKNGAFCWRINGHETGIPATGPKGDIGKTSRLYFVTIDTPDYIDKNTTNELNIKYIYTVKYGGGNYEIDKVDVYDFINNSSNKYENEYVEGFTDNSMAIVVEDIYHEAPNENDIIESNGKMWISPIIKTTQNNFTTYKVVCGEENKLNVNVDRQAFKNMFYAIGNPAAQTAPGIIVPIDYSESEMEETKYLRGHMLYHLNEPTGNINNSYINTLYVAPVKNTTIYPSLDTHTNSADKNDALLNDKSSIKLMYDDAYFKGAINVGGGINLAGDVTAGGNVIANGMLGVSGDCNIGGNLTVAGTFELPELTSIKIGEFVVGENTPPIDEIVNGDGIDENYSLHSDWMKTVINRNLIIGNTKHNLNNTCDIRAYVNDSNIELCDNKYNKNPQLSITSGEYFNISSLGTAKEDYVSKSKLSIINNEDGFNGLTIKYEYLVNVNENNVDKPLWEKKSVSINLSKLFESNKFNEFIAGLNGKDKEYTNTDYSGKTIYAPSGSNHNEIDPSSYIKIEMTNNHEINTNTQ